MISDDGVRVDDDVRQNGGVVADDGAFAYDSVRCDMCVPSNFRRGMNDSGGMNARRVLGFLIKELHGFGEGKIRVCGAERGGGDLGKIGRRQDGSGPGRAGQRRISWVCDKRQVFRSGFFETGDSADGLVGVAVEFGAKHARKFS